MFETKSNSKDIKTDTQKQQYNLDKSNKRPNQSIAHRKYQSKGYPIKLSLKKHDENLTTNTKPIQINTILEKLKKKKMTYYRFDRYKSRPGVVDKPINDRLYISLSGNRLYTENQSYKKELYSLSNVIQCINAKQFELAHKYVQKVLKGSMKYLLIKLIEGAELAERKYYIILTLCNSKDEEVLADVYRIEWTTLKKIIHQFFAYERMKNIVLHGSKKERRWRFELNPEDSEVYYKLKEINRHYYEQMKYNTYLIKLKLEIVSATKEMAAVLGYSSNIFSLDNFNHYKKNLIDEVLKLKRYHADLRSRSTEHITRLYQYALNNKRRSGRQKYHYEETGKRYIDILRKENDKIINMMKEKEKKCYRLRNVLVETETKRDGLKDKLNIKRKVIAELKYSVYILVARTRYDYKSIYRLSLKKELLNHEYGKSRSTERLKNDTDKSLSFKLQMENLTRIRNNLEELERRKEENYKSIQILYERKYSLEKQVKGEEQTLERLVTEYSLKKQQIYALKNYLENNRRIDDWYVNYFETRNQQLTLLDNKISERSSAKGTLYATIASLESNYRYKYTNIQQLNDAKNKLDGYLKKYQIKIQYVQQQYKLQEAYIYKVKYNIKQVIKCHDYKVNELYGVENILKSQTSKQEYVILTIRNKYAEQLKLEESIEARKTKNVSLYYSIRDQTEKYNNLQNSLDDLKQKCAQLTAQMKQQKEESRNLADQIVVENNRLLALQTEVERKSDQKQILEAYLLSHNKSLDNILLRIAEYTTVLSKLLNKKDLNYRYYKQINKNNYLTIQLVQDYEYLPAELVDKRRKLDKLNYDIRIKYKYVSSLYSSGLTQRQALYSLQEYIHKKTENLDNLKRYLTVVQNSFGKENQQLIYLENYKRHTKYTLYLLTLYLRSLEAELIDKHKRSYNIDCELREATYKLANIKVQKDTIEKYEPKLFFGYSISMVYTPKKTKYPQSTSTGLNLTSEAHKESYRLFEQQQLSESFYSESSLRNRSIYESKYHCTEILKYLAESKYRLSQSPDFLLGWKERKIEENFDLKDHIVEKIVECEAYFMQKKAKLVQLDQKLEEDKEYLAECYYYLKRSMHRFSELYKSDIGQKEGKLESIWQRESESTNISEIEKTIYELMVKEDKLMQDNKLLREYCERLKVYKEEFEIQTQKKILYCYYLTKQCDLLLKDMYKIRRTEYQMLVYNYKLKSSEVQLLSDFEAYKRQFEEYRDKLRLYIRTIELKDRNINALFFGTVLDEQYEHKRYLVECLEQHTGRRIKKTKLIFSYDLLNRTNFHKYIDNIAPFVVLVKTYSNRFLAGYSEGPLVPRMASTSDGLIISLTNKRVYRLVENNKRATTYDEFYIIFGAAYLRIRTNYLTIFSNFGMINMAYYGRNESVDILLGEGNKREVKIEHYEVQQLFYY